MFLICLEKKKQKILLFSDMLFIFSFPILAMMYNDKIWLAITGSYILMDFSYFIQTSYFWLSQLKFPMKLQRAIAENF
jgi:hypothetical protein